MDSVCNRLSQSAGRFMAKIAFRWIPRRQLVRLPIVLFKPLQASRRSTREAIHMKLFAVSKCWNWFEAKMVSDGICIGASIRLLRIYSSNREFKQTPSNDVCVLFASLYSPHFYPLFWGHLANTKIPRVLGAFMVSPKKDKC